MKEIRHLRSHCSTVVDQIPVKFVTFVSEHIAGALIHYQYLSSNMENCSSFTHPKDGSPTKRQRLAPSIYTAGSSKRV